MTFLSRLARENEVQSPRERRSGRVGEANPRWLIPIFPSTRRDTSDRADSSNRPEGARDRGLNPLVARRSRLPLDEFSAAREPHLEVFTKGERMAILKLLIGFIEDFFAPASGTRTTTSWTVWSALQTSPARAASQGAVNVEDLPHAILLCLFLRDQAERRG